MCGIAGYLGDSSPRAVTAVRGMLHALRRRGPDAEGLESFPQAVLGHRRLAIFDLSEAGRQPLLSPDGQTAVVFNGAIYNFQDLRAELEAAGFCFRTRTDTEVLLHGYRQWGIHRLIERLRGMFAVVLWDNRTGTAYLFRDRLGVKPLHYLEHDGRLAFASTARALRAGGLVRDIDPQGVAEFLEFGYVTDERSIYAGAGKLAPGTLLEWREGKFLGRHTYWQVPAIERHAPVRFAEAVEHTERLLLEAVRLRLEADVPVGALLSGGVDSSLICWAIAQSGAKITAFTVGTPGEAGDETAEASATARQLGIRHEVIAMQASQQATLEDLVEAYGEPFACSSALGMLEVSRAVRASSTVLLTGDGGDDVFLGYPEHKYFWMAQRLAGWIPPWLARHSRVWIERLPAHGPAKRLRSFLGYATGGLGAVAAAHPGLRVLRAQGILGPRLREVRVAAEQLPWSHDSARNLVEEFLAYEHRTRFTGEYMTKVDGGSMHYALEARSPFLDQEIWNYAARLPVKVRLQGGALKAILRELARRHLGPRVSRGKKRGFSVPLNRWLAGAWRATAEDLLTGSRLAAEGWIEADAARAAFQREAARGVVSNGLLYVLVLEAWLRRERG
jgi:asparagine synthase (glutamine-hydrolysing)